jgi:undecaprenyl-diphosphatase
MENNIDTRLEKSPPQTKTKWITVRFILAIILFLVTLIVFVGIADQIVLDHKNNFDKVISGYIQSFTSPAMTRAMIRITFFGSSTFLFPAYLALILFYLIRKRRTLALDITMVGLSSTGILFLLKDIFRRHRPLDPLISHVTGFSFPSGHSFSSFTFFGLLIYIAWHSDIKKSWKIIISALLVLFAATIAFSRIYLRVHFPSDVVAGFCLSVVWLMLSLAILHQADRGLSRSKNRD